jgi:hypothetical protein
MSDVEIDVVLGEGEGEFIGTPLEELIPEEETQEEIKAYLSAELDAVEIDREKFIKKVKKWRRQREAKPEKETTDYPWPNASNISVPVAATTTNRIFGMAMQKYGGKKPLIEVETTDKGMKDAADALGSLINKVMLNPLYVDFERKNQTILYENVSIGTEFVKVPWTNERWIFKRDGGNVDKTIYNGPNVIPLKIEDVYLRSQWKDVQKAPWIAIKTRYMDYELRQQVQNGYFEGVEAFLGTGEELEATVVDHLNDKGMEPSISELNPEYEIYETFIYWDIDGDGIAEDIKIFYHKESETIIRAELNELGVRDIMYFNYFQDPYSVYGKGIGSMSEHTQDEVDTLHNMRINSAHLSSLQLFKSKRGFGMKKMSFRPLQNIEVNNMDDLQVMAFPNVGQSLLQPEIMSIQQLNDYTGAASPAAGVPNASAGTRQTASGTMFLAQQGTKIFDAATTNLDHSYGEMALLMAFQIIAADTPGQRNQILSLLTEIEREAIAPLLALKPEDLPGKFNFIVKTTDIEQTKEGKRQNNLMIHQLFDAYSQTMLQYAQAYLQSPEQLKELIMKMMVAKSKLMEETLELLGEAKPGELVAYYKDMEMFVSMIEQEKDMQVAQAQKQMGGQGEVQDMGAEYGAGPGDVSGQPELAQGVSIESGDGVAPGEVPE